MKMLGRNGEEKDVQFAGTIAMPKWGTVTLLQAAAFLGTTPDNLRGAIKRGSLKATKRGRDWWVTPREVERYGKENRRRQKENKR